MPNCNVNHLNCCTNIPTALIIVHKQKTSSKHTKNYLVSVGGQRRRRRRRRGRETKAGLRRRDLGF
jgi:hypothetical protein